VKRLVVPALASALLAACGGASAGDDGCDRPGTTLTVLAAASLTESFETIGERFHADDPCVHVRFSFGPSDGLATQIVEGSPADVFASASPSWMDVVAGDGPGVRDRADFARNSLVVITPAHDAATVTSIDDLANDGVTLVLAAEGVPAGDYAREVFANAGIDEAALDNVVSNEEDVKGVVQKVILGEADAGIVYRTDVTDEIRPQVRTVAIPDEVNVVATYPIAVVASTEEPDEAGAFVAYVVGGGQDVLRAAGFLPAD
jgi:molybdate transport system substrate-binding protein